MKGTATRHVAGKAVGLLLASCLLFAPHGDAQVTTSGNDENLSFSFVSSDELTCEAVTNACANDAVCSECATAMPRRARRKNRRLQEEGDDDGEDDDNDGDDDDDDDGDEGGSTQSCTSRYPEAILGPSSFCQRAGAGYCCEFDDNDVAATCLQNSLVAQSWDCFLQDLECSVSHMPCSAEYVGLGPPSPAPTAIAFVTLAPTSSPTIGSTISPTMTPTSSPTSRPTAAPTTPATTAVPSAAPTVADRDLPISSSTSLSEDEFPPTTSPTSAPTASGSGSRGDVDGSTDASGAATAVDVSLLAWTGPVSGVVTAAVLGLLAAFVGW